MPYEPSYLVRLQRAADDSGDIGVAIAHVSEETGELYYVQALYLPSTSRTQTYISWTTWLLNFDDSPMIYVKTNDVRMHAKRSPRFERLKYAGKLDTGPFDSLGKYCFQALSSKESGECVID